MVSSRKPIIGVPASILQMSGSPVLSNAAGKRYIDSLMEFSNCIPLIIPAHANSDETDKLLDNFDGIFLSGGRANVEPHHYGAEPFPPDEMIDPDRDNTVLPIIRKCIERKIFNHNKLKEVILEHTNEKRDHSTFLFRLLSVELWFRTFIDEE